jgi:hypothetical protein
MQRSARMAAFAACSMLLAASLSAAYADPLIWPWKDKMPPDPALAILSSVDSVSAAINKTNPPTVTIKVGASAPTPNFTELQLTPRIGDPKDQIFSFDAKGRPPQDMTIQVITRVEISAEYSDAPVESLGVVEVYGQANCKAFSLKDNKEVECSAKSLPAMPSTGTADGQQ